ncbi:alpha/beta fold hydrolase [Gryllotalpicola ginsengisoli]|uniref:alpha/beta fold hydrolase n=1 Tax=Gryllotalpicola ginsengisoli TaxID=444608 RepID=UPI0003B5CE22|nr:alpha/beta fold hydrolase [Gryllotalpicola ginsengisoli]
MTVTAEYTIPGLHVREHEASVPLDWNHPDAGTITVFARELVTPTKRHEDLPCLLFLQGGPGGKGPRPVTASGWIAEALKNYRVVLLDQRGTGRSTRVDARTIGRFGTAVEAAEYLAHFRADQIVRDAEHLREHVFGGKRWTTLGQSYGGFLTLSYLSLAPEGLAACLVTGGLASVTRPDAELVYRRTYPRVEAKNAEYRRRYPHDVAAIERIADRLAASPVTLPDGDVLTVRRFQTLGMGFGMKHPGYEQVHWLVDEAFDWKGEELDDGFLAQVAAATDFATNPLYAVLQEAIYASGPDAGPTAWAAQRVRDELPAFAESARPLLLTGEMIYPWQFAELRSLKPFEAAAHALHERESWSTLYDTARLAANEVPVYAAVYFDDMYVDSGLQLETAQAVGNLHPWVTNEFEHDGLRNGDVFARLHALLEADGGALR